MTATVEAEKQVCMPLRNPATGRSSTKFYYAGAIDLIGGGRIVDWKSASDTTGFAAKKSIGYQPECYALALRRLGYEVTEYEYRVIQTPSITLCGKDYSSALEDIASVRGCKVSELPESISAVVNVQARNAYEQRCYEWIQSDPTRLLSLVYPITETQLAQAESWLWSVKERIQLARKTGCYLTNENACDTWSRRCPYIDLCKTAKEGGDVYNQLHATYEMGASHRELSLPPHVSEQNVITYSSASRFSLCEQRYYWSNVLGLQLRNEPTNETLYTGSAMHAGLEALSTEGLEAALNAIENWERANPVIGEEATQKQDQSVARARAMVRAAAEKWMA